ncbi:MAG: NERD domain-containing protein [Phycisphaera sp.]|nr:MAG: NERD domain-containing protein [Phycisphaera sp.]
MIVKEYEEKSKTGNSAVDAGHGAEKQMAFYLRRAFGSHREIFILNDIRIVDPEQQTESLLGEDACQIDHLVLHKLGMFIIESKSAVGKVTVSSDGTGGDEWVFGSRGRRSPLKQAEMQAEYIRTYLTNNQEQLLGKFPKGTRTLAKLINGTDQRGVRHMPMQAIVALSDKATIQRKGWKEPSEPFQAYVCKADLVPDKVLTEFKRHQSAAKLLSRGDGEYGMWWMKAEEVLPIAEFLRDSNSSRVHSGPKKVVPKAVEQAATQAIHKKKANKESGPACKACGSNSLSARYGKYGYYWACLDCQQNTAMPKLCGVCGADGKKNKDVRVRKEGQKYFTSCAACGIEECIWTEPVATG